MDLGSCRFCQIVLTVNDMSLKVSEVRVGDLGASENQGGFHVHFFWRRVYNR